MKFKVTLKDPDDSEINAITDARKDKVNKALRNWVEYGEYITIEFDTEAGTATVVPL